MNTFEGLSSVSDRVVHGVPYLYLDIETIPAQSPEVHARIAETITPPANYSKPETIAKWNEDQKPAAIKEAIAKTALDGSAGHVCCIGWAWSAGEPLSMIWGEDGSEKALLQDFVDAIDGATIGNRIPIIVGHNVINFDIRFLWQRAIVLGVQMPSWFPRDPKAWSPDVFDTMTAFAGQRGMIGMDRLCLALGMEGKGDVDGSMIGQLWAAGEYQKIEAYCMADVERTRAIHRRMQVAYGECAA